MSIELTSTEIRAYFHIRAPLVRQRGKEWRGPCPIHKGERDSFAVDPETGRFWCHSECGTGGDIPELEQKLSGCDFKSAMKLISEIIGRPMPANGNGSAAHGNPAKPKTNVPSQGVKNSQSRPRELVDSYPYHDEAGLGLFVVKRYSFTDQDGGKTFVAGHTDPVGGKWVNNIQGVRRVPFNLPNVMKANQVFIVEGEKDVRTLESIGLTASTNVFGAGKWTDDYAPHFAGKDIVILPDNDQAGRDHGEKVARSLQSHAARVRILDLPDLEEKQDVSDWIANGHSREELLELVKAAPDWAAHATTHAQPVNATSPNEQDPARGREFKIDDNALDCEYWDPKKQKRIRKPISPAIQVIAKTRNFEDEGYGLLLSFRNCEGRDKRCILARSALYGDGKEPLEPLFNMGFEPERDRFSIDALKDYLHSREPGKFIRCVQRVGWNAGHFVFPDHTISPMDAPEAVMFHTDGQVDHKYKRSGTLADWKQHVSRLCVGNSRLIFAVSCAFAAPLLELVKADGCGFHFRGLSSIGKSTVLFVAGSVWGGGSHAGFLETWRATANGLETQAALHNDALLCLDEISEVDEREAGEISYFLANGRGKSRATKNITSRTATQFKLIYLSTGEHTLAEIMEATGRQAKGGQEARLIEIPADAGRNLGMWESLHEHKEPAQFSESLKKAARTYYGTPVLPWLEHLAGNGQEITDEVTELRTKFIRENVPPNSSGEVRRAAFMFGLIAAAGELSTRIGLTGWPEGNAWKAARTCFRSWIETRGGIGAMDVERGITKVRLFIAQHGASRFQDINEPANKIPNRAGWKESVDDYTLYYFQSDVFRSEVCKGFDHEAVVDGLCKRGHALKSEDRLQYAKKLPTDANHRQRKKAWVYAIKSTLSEVDDFSGDDYSEIAGTVGTEEEI